MARLAGEDRQRRPDRAPLGCPLQVIIVTLLLLLLLIIIIMIITMINIIMIIIITTNRKYSDEVRLENLDQEAVRLPAKLLEHSLSACLGEEAEIGSVVAACQNLACHINSDSSSKRNKEHMSQNILEHLSNAQNA